MIKIGQQYKRKTKKYTVKQINTKGQFTYVYMLRKDLDDEPKNYEIYGKKIIENEFKLIKEVKNE